MRFITKTGLPVDRCPYTVYTEKHHVRVHMWAYTSNSAVYRYHSVLYIGKLGMHRYGNGSGGIWPELSQTMK